MKFTHTVAGHVLASITMAALLASVSVTSKADVITDWNQKTDEIITEAKMGTPPAVRLAALVQTAAYEAVNAITHRYPAKNPPASAAKTVSVEAAVAAAHRTVLLKLLPAQQSMIDAAYQATLTPITDAVARSVGVSIGEKAASEVLAQRGDDGAAKPESYRPHTNPGVYVPTASTAVPQWAQRKPWLLTSAAQLRPSAPPALTSDVWLRDFNEVKSIGGRTSALRTAEQTEIARFWEYSLPAIYFGVVRSVAQQPGREVTRNARLLALAAQAMDDAIISVWDAKYHYNFWRPATAIRNGDVDGHDDTQRDPAWAPLIDAPLHPEYPSGHSILAATVATLLKAELGAGPMPVLSTISPTAKGATRRWTNVDEFVKEVSDARIYGGIHFRTATDTGAAMGRQIGGLAAQHLLLPQ